MYLTSTRRNKMQICAVLHLVLIQTFTDFKSNKRSGIFTDAKASLAKVQEWTKQSDASQIKFRRNPLCNVLDLLQNIYRCKGIHTRLLVAKCQVPLALSFSGSALRTKEEKKRKVKNNQIASASVLRICDSTGRRAGESPRQITGAARPPPPPASPPRGAAPALVSSSAPTASGAPASCRPRGRGGGRGARP